MLLSLHTGPITSSSEHDNEGATLENEGLQDIGGGQKLLQNLEGELMNDFAQIEEMGEGYGNYQNR